MQFSNISIVHSERKRDTTYPFLQCVIFAVSVFLYLVVAMYCQQGLKQFYVTGVLGATHVEIEHHLEMGRKLLAAGQLAEALSHYHSAVGKVTHVELQTHASSHHHWLIFHSIFITLLQTKWKSKFSPILYFCQRETLRTIWRTTNEQQCFWPWENPNLLCQTWPEPFSSSLTFWLYVYNNSLPYIRNVNFILCLLGPGS